MAEKIGQDKRFSEEGVPDFNSFSGDMANMSFNDTYNLYSFVEDDTLKAYTPKFQALQICLSVYYAILIVIGLIGNCLVIIPFLTRSSLRKVSSNFFVVHMAVLNIINICFLYPSMLARFVFVRGRDDNGGNAIICRISLVVFDLLFLEPALFSMLCVALNRCLLIASPQKLYRRLCTKTPIALILVGFYVLLCLRAGLKMAYMNVQSTRHQCWIKGYTNPAMDTVDLTYLILLDAAPTLLIPVCHVSILCYIRASRKRVAKGTFRRSNALVIETEGGSTVTTAALKTRPRTLRRTSSTSSSSSFVISDAVSTAMTTVTLEPVFEIDGNDNIDTPCCSYAIPSSGIKRDQTVNGNTNVSTDQDTITNISPRPPCPNALPKSGDQDRDEGAILKRGKRVLKRTLSRHTSRSMLMSTDRNGKADVKGQGSNKAEVRLIKMMIAMYVIIIVIWIASMLLTHVIVYWFAHYVLQAMGTLIPLCHAIVPYIYLWGNRNYHDAIRSYRICSCLRCNAVSPN